MQHFHITYLHRWSAPELTIATEYSLRDMHEGGIKDDSAQYLIYEFHRGKKSIDNAGNSKFVRPHLMYLGGVLVLTRIFYFAMGKLALLPPPLHIPHGVTPKHTTRPLAHGRPAREQAPQKEVPQRHAHEDVPRRTTRSGERQARKASKSSPAPSSPSDQEAKKYKEELAQAMRVSREELKKGDEEELQQLK